LPAQYEYVVGADGHLEFSPAAAGELVEISYRYHPKRVGIWLTGPVTDPHVTRGVDTLLATLLQERGIEPVAAYVTNTSSSEIEKALREIDGDALLVISMSKVEGDEVAAKLAAYRPVAVGGEIARWTSDREQRFRAPEGGSAGDRRVVSLDRLRTGLENLLEPWFAQLGLTRPPSLLRTGEHQAP
jgi:PIN domain nuclease of toxin-antitoxin system